MEKGCFLQHSLERFAGRDCLRKRQTSAGRQTTSRSARESQDCHEGCLEVQLRVAYLDYISQAA